MTQVVLSGKNRTVSIKGINQERDWDTSVPNRRVRKCDNGRNRRDSVSRLGQRLGHILRWKRCSQVQLGKKRSGGRRKEVSNYLFDDVQFGHPRPTMSPIL